ncbi:hypothetical protein JCM24511_02062 [Saitozyma sp. JCM 24511]|nr:hypothetical protein JCM24511_02062 [Saitozyma sp. JCM 24511]
MSERIQQVVADLNDLDAFYNVAISPTRWDKISGYCFAQLAALERTLSLSSTFLLRTALRPRIERIDQDRETTARMAPLLPFVPVLIELCEARQRMQTAKSEDVADILVGVLESIQDVRSPVELGELTTRRARCQKGAGQDDASRDVGALVLFQNLLSEFFSFSAGHHPIFDWWVRQPGTAVLAALRDLVQTFQRNLVGISLRSADDIIGEPIRRAALLKELAHEVIAYSPEELIGIAAKEYRWREAEMKRAAGEIGQGTRWRDPLEHVKKQHVESGVEKQTDLASDLAREAIAFVCYHDLVSVPDIAASTLRMFMLSAAQQKLAPYFLGGSSILVASHAARRGYVPAQQQPPFLARHRLPPAGVRSSWASATGPTVDSAYGLGGTPFYVEGWGVYWEMLFWNRGEFFLTPEDCIGALFWGMHRCARILFSLSFHLGIMLPRESRPARQPRGARKVGGRGRAPEESRGRVHAAVPGGVPARRAATREVLEEGRMGEKALHDVVLRMNAVPIELLGATLLGMPMGRDFRANWRFYEKKA